MRLAVVGHVEWGDFLVQARLPRTGEILEARSGHEGPGGGGAMGALALLALHGQCAFLTSVGDDERGARTAAALRAAGLEVHAAVQACPQRRVVTSLTDDGERTITILGLRHVPHGDDALPWSTLGAYDGVYFTGGDAAALQATRAARVVVATPRARTALLGAGVRVDVLVASSGDAGEAVDAPLAALAEHVVLTEGAAGGSWRSADGTGGRWSVAPAPARIFDAYGCGDSFAAALAYGLAAGDTVAGACARSARVGAAMLGVRAPGIADLAAVR